jgi:hypothetical protein
LEDFMTICAVSWDSGIPGVVMIWNGYANSGEFRAANESILDMVSTNRAAKLLGDVTRFKLIAGNDQTWLNESWIPRVIESGLRYVALVSPTYYFNQVAVDNVSGRVDKSRLAVQQFSDWQQARSWLAAQ